MSYNNKFALTILTLLLNCAQRSSVDYQHPDTWIAEIPVVGTVLPDEEDALIRLAGSIETLHGLDSFPTVMFIRSPSQQIPQICDDGCTTVWSEVPNILGPPERVPGEGYSGLELDGWIFVSRIGSRESALDELLAHEAAHWVCDCNDGPEVQDIENLILSGMLASPL